MSWGRRGEVRRYLHASIWAVFDVEGGDRIWDTESEGHIFHAAVDLIHDVVDCSLELSW